MSVRVMADVWRLSAASGNTLLVLLKLADNADESSRLAWPSVADLAAGARCDERTVQRHLRRLIEMGELERVRAGGRVNGENRATVYRVLVGRQSATPNGDRGDNPRHLGVSAVSPYPSKEPSYSSFRERCLTEFRAWAEQHERVTGMVLPREGTKARQRVMQSFSARLADGLTTDDLRLASVGAQADRWRRENGYTSAESVLRPLKIGALVAKGRAAEGEQGTVDVEALNEQAMRHG